MLKMNPKILSEVLVPFEGTLARLTKGVRIYIK